MLIMGVSPTPPLTSTTGRAKTWRMKNSPAGGVAFSVVPGAALSCNG